MRRNDGTFQPGYSGNPKGRPPRNYSIAHALSVVANDPASIDDDGNPLTYAQVASQWLWRIVRDGIDRRSTPDGAPEFVQVGTKDRLNALVTILNRIEPDYKLTPDQVDAMSDEEAEQVLEKLDDLSDEELAVLEKLGVKR